MDSVLSDCFVSTSVFLSSYYSVFSKVKTETCKRAKLFQNNVALPFWGVVKCCGEVIERNPYFFLIEENSQQYQSLQSFSPIEVARIKDHLEWEAALKIWKTVIDTEPELESLSLTIPDESDFASNTVCLIGRKNKQVVAAGRYIIKSANVEIDRVAVLPEFRGQGIGRSLIQTILRWNLFNQGAIYVKAFPHEMGFYSILGFECQSYPERSRGFIRYKMVYMPPICNYSSNCVGLHHISIYVTDIEKSLAFYGILGFILMEKFMTKEHLRACFLQGMGMRLELIEDIGLFSKKKDALTIWNSCILVFDVTKACIDLESYLLDIRRRNGGILHMKAFPGQQVIGGEVVEVATIEDPDRIPLEFIRRQIVLPREASYKMNHW
ncbi:hypothetical protein GpartN1_g2797.t1 [Galdieria partita]|uniref:N-acetyltransferase domain-containing protein n=1 Tax=Galdieria partita TaxID=83374 RepID=A0A9C7UPW6_9RHOD|nr:hypothetical protein GpartN1_g2797.t1 [Galdieria partita]